MIKGMAQTHTHTVTHLLTHIQTLTLSLTHTPYPNDRQNFEQRKSKIHFFSSQKIVSTLSQEVFTTTQPLRPFIIQMGGRKGE